MSREVLFGIPEGRAADVARRLARGVRTVPERDGAETATVLDTFDWRLLHAGIRLQVVRPDRGEPVLKFLGEAGLIELPWGENPTPGLGRELPEGVVSRRIARVVGPRRLLERVRIHRVATRRRVVDSEGKTVGRICAETEVGACAGGVGHVALADRLRIGGVVGYDGAFERLLGATVGAGRIGEPIDDELATAAEALGLDLRYTGRERPHVEPAWRSDTALMTVLLSLLDTMEAMEAGVRSDLDSEFLHDFRVAVRRTRVALGQLESVLDPAVARRFKREFRWLGLISGPTRDLDVFLLEIPSYRRELPGDQREALGALETHLRHRQRDSQRELAAHLAGERYRTIVRDWRSYLEAPETATPATPDGDRPVFEVACHRIRRALSKVVRDGRAIEATTPTAALHRLRIDCKKLRYLLELFGSLFPARPVDRFVRSLKKLQDNLGDLNDCAVQRARLATFAEEMMASGEATAKTLLAMGRLQARLEDREATERHRFHGRFSKFASAKRLERAERLFATPNERLR